MENRKNGRLEVSNQKRYKFDVHLCAMQYSIQPTPDTFATNAGALPLTGLLDCTRVPNLQKQERTTRISSCEREHSMSNLVESAVPLSLN